MCFGLVTTVALSSLLRRLDFSIQNFIKVENYKKNYERRARKEVGEILFEKYDCWESFYSKRAVCGTTRGG